MPEPTFAPAPSFAIGEFDQTVFDCPSCARPLALGARRCPGCRTRLIHGVVLAKASIFIAAGLAVGLLAGVGGGFVFGRMLSPGTAAAIAGPLIESNVLPDASAAPTASPMPGASATPRATATPDPGVPPVTRSALAQVVATNGRLAAAATDLRAELAAKSFDASAVAQIFRTITPESLYGMQLAARISSWTRTAPLGAQLASSYGAIRATADDALNASVQNAPVYRAAAKDMVKLLEGMAEVDAAVREAATAAGITLPATSVPTAP